MLGSFIIWWHLILDIPDESDSHFSGIITSQNVADELCVDLHLNLQIGKR